MAKEAAYKKKIKEQQEILDKYKNVADKYALERKVYKCSNLQLLNLFLEGKYSSSEIISVIKITNNKEAWEYIRTKLSEKDYKEYITFLSLLLKKSDNFLTKKNLQALHSIIYYKNYFIRSIEEWEPKFTNPDRQLSILLKHLFIKYKVPDFLEKGFYGGMNIEMIELYLHIGLGKSFKKFPLVPALKLNNKVYHYLLNTPSHFTYFEAFRRAQILSIGGTERLVTAFLRSKLSDRKTEKQEDFWYTVIQAFIDVPMLNMDKIPEVIDYINNQKYEASLKYGQMIIPMPNFSMKGRTIISLVEKSDKWHAEQTRARGIWKNSTFQKWDAIGIRDYSKDAKISAGNTKIDTVYKIKQLLTSDEVREEGRRMRNCVASYISSCVNKSCAIFSVQDLILEGRYATIEIRTHEIKQVREQSNKRISKTSFIYKIIMEWVDREKLTISNYAF